MAKSNGVQSLMQVQPGYIEVVRVSDPFPGLRRVTFKGERLRSFPASCAAGHIKLFFPTRPGSVPQLPHRDANGNKVWPNERPITRTYSVRAFDVARQKLDVDFVLHEAPGPASDWARTASLGHIIGIAGPAVPPVFAEAKPWNLFVGDLSALPMISALVEALPADSAATVLVEVPMAQPVTFANQCVVSVSQRRGDRGERLLEMVQQVDWPPQGTPCRVCVAAESRVTVAIRKYLEQHIQLPRSAMYTVPYWKHAATEEEYHQERHAQMDAMG